MAIFGELGVGIKKFLGYHRLRLAQFGNVESAATMSIDKMIERGTTRMTGAMDTPWQALGYFIGRVHQECGDHQLEDPKHAVDLCGEFIPNNDRTQIECEIATGYDHSRSNSLERDEAAAARLSQQTHAFAQSIAPLVKKQLARLEINAGTDPLRRYFAPLDRLENVATSGAQSGGPPNTGKATPRKNYTTIAEIAQEFRSGLLRKLSIAEILDLPDIAREMQSADPDSTLEEKLQVADHAFEVENIRLVVPTDQGTSVKRNTLIDLEDASSLTSNDLREQASPIRVNIDWEMKCWSVETVLNRIDLKSINVRPTYQRNFVWGQAKISALIESLLINVPIPPIYLSRKTGSDTYDVVDGQQRLSALQSFIRTKRIALSNARPVLRDPDFRTDLRGKQFDQFSPEDQRKVLNTDLSFVVITEADQKEINGSRFDPAIETFTRLNQAATPLKPMELRNALFHGVYMELLRGMPMPASDILAGVTPANAIRMEKEEAALMLFALWRSGTTGYQRKSTFLDDEMRANRDVSLPRLNEMRAAFKSGARLASMIFEKDSADFARIFTPGSKTLPDGNWESKPCEGLFYVVLASLMRETDDKTLVERSAAVRELCVHLVSHSRRFRSTVKDRYTNKSNLTLAWDVWTSKLANISSAPVATKWISRRRELWRDSCCACCGEAVKAEIDARPFDLHAQDEYWITDTDFQTIAHRECYNLVKAL